MTTLETIHEPITIEPIPVRGRVTIGDFDMPFWNLANFMFKIMLASIPAALVFFITVVVSMALLGGSLGAIVKLLEWLIR